MTTRWVYLTTFALVSVWSTLIAADQTAKSLGHSYGDVMALEQPQPSARYHYGNSPLQFGELWLPDAPSPTALPIVVFIHGGCWLNAYDIKHSYAITEAIAKQGYAVFSLEYRRTGDEGGGWPGSYHDIINGIAYLPELAQLSAQPLNLDRVTLVGHSAGGHLAVLAGGAIDYGELDSEQVDAAQLSKVTVERVVGLAAITDIATYARGSNSCEQATPSFMGGLPKDVPDQYYAANPSEQPVHPNTILLQGDQDTIVDTDHALLQSGTALWVVGAGHFDMIHPNSDAFGQLVTALNGTP